MDSKIGSVDQVVVSILSFCAESLNPSAFSSPLINVYTHQKQQVVLLARKLCCDDLTVLTQAVANF